MSAAGDSRGKRDYPFDTTAASMLCQARSQLIVLTPKPQMFIIVSKVTNLIAKESREHLICPEMAGCVQL